MKRPTIAPVKRSKPKSVAGQDQSMVTVGQYAYQVIDQQYHHMVCQEDGVQADQDPEYVHQMRVGSRRLRTALQVFSPVVRLPKSAGEKSIRAIAQTLGKLRDLDVQMADIQADYGQQVHHKAERKALKQTLAALKEQRLEAFAQVTALLTEARYAKLKQAYEDWLQAPQFTAIADLPLRLVLPDLLNPLIAKLLLHPGWLISVQATSTASRQTLHDLRKVCKHVRYQAEFFKGFYGPGFRDWVDELKLLQDNLGTVQDTYVFIGLLDTQSYLLDNLPELHHAIEARRHQALLNWETVRHRYLSEDFRYHLYHQILSRGTSTDSP